MNKDLTNNIEYIFYTCLGTWVCLPEYVYTEEYKHEFIKFCIKKIKTENICDLKTLVFMTLDHEIGNKKPYFDFKRK